MIQVGIATTLYPTDEPLDFDTSAGDSIHMHPLLSWDEEVLAGQADGHELSLQVKGIGTLAFDKTDLLDALLTLAARRKGGLDVPLSVDSLREALDAEVDE